jgi:hypothetical protein
LAEDGIPEICPFEVGSSEIYLFKIRAYVWILSPPLIPGFHSLLENINMFLISMGYLPSTGIYCSIEALSRGTQQHRRET